MAHLAQPACNAFYRILRRRLAARRPEVAGVPEDLSWFRPVDFADYTLLQYSVIRNNDEPILSFLLLRALIRYGLDELRSR